MSLPRMARKSLRLPSSWATEINLQSRYPGGILPPKIGELSSSAPPAARVIVPLKLIAMAAAIRKTEICFMDRLSGCSFLSLAAGDQGRDSLEGSLPSPPRWGLGLHIHFIRLAARAQACTGRSPIRSRSERRNRAYRPLPDAPARRARPELRRTCLCSIEARRLSAFRTD